MRCIANTLVILTAASLSPMFSQNLLPNPSFETYTECPITLNQGEPLQCIPWTHGNAGSTDYFNSCASPGNAGVPVNFAGNQWPVSGVAYTGVVAHDSEPEYREYVQAPLSNPLIAGTAYLVTFYISPGDEFCGTKPFGALFTVNTPQYNGYLVLDYTPQIEVYGEYLNNFSDWTLISRCFIADGGESYITIGNFRDDNETLIEPGCNASIAYYYIDHVSVEAMSLAEDVFEMDSVVACDSFEIFPGQAQNYTWSDGTTLPTLTVYESGTYYVTLSDECSFSYGEIDVTILPDAPPVSLPNDTLLCTGESISISLDPDAGIYAWQDGSSDSEYIISAEGEYIVELADDCDMTSDTINVTFLNPPSPFSLGEDTLICDGDAFTISFEPSLGDFMWQDGSNSSSFTIEDDGIYALTISNMCGQAEDEITVDFVQPIVVDIGPDQMTLCDGNEFQIELDPSLGDFLWHDDSDGNSFTISEAGVVSVTVSNACYTETDEMLVDVLYQPEFTLGPDITVCSGQFPITLDMSGVDHAQSWEWTGGSTQSLYQVTAPGTYSVTISNDCFAMSDEIVVSLGDVDPVVTLPADQLLCPGQTILLDAGGIQGSYQWQDLSTADTFLVTQPGQYMLTVTTSCGSGADTIVVDYVPALSSPDLGPDFSLCPGETGVLYANVDNVSYLWSESTAGTIGTADSIVIASAGSYALQINDACSSASDTVVVTLNANPPDVDLPAALSLCQGDTVVIDAGITGVSYLWNDGGVEAQCIAPLPGLYSLTVTNACGTDVDSVLINDAGAEPLVDLGNDVSLCPGDQLTITPLGIDVDSWLWSASTGSATTDSTFIIDTAGIVVVQGFNQCGQASDTIEVTLLPAIPLLDLGEDVSLCPGETATLSITIPDVDILWSDNSSGNAFEVSSAGEVHAMITNACGSSMDTVVVILLDAIPDLDLGADQSLCPGETITIDPGIPDVDYLWQDMNGVVISTSSTTVVDSAGTIILTISNACGTSSDTVVIIEDSSGPQVDLGDDILACEGEIVVIEAGISGVDYLWALSTGEVSTGSTTAVDSSATIILMVSNACGMDTDTILVDIHGVIPAPSLGPDTMLCDDEMLILTADASNMIEWNDGSDDPSFTITTTGVYSLLEKNHCGSGSDTISVTYQSAPIPFDLGEDVELCAGDSVVLFAPVTTDPLMWQDGSSGATFIATQSQLYSLVISNECGSVTDDVLVTIDTQVPVVELSADQELCAGQSLLLNADQEFFSSYLWSTGSTQPSIVITHPDVYAVTVMTDCYEASDEITIVSDDDCIVDTGLYIPNVFSPNGDGVNDEWIVSLNDVSISGVQCRIFDRWGEMMFETKQLPIIWDGKFQSKNLNPGVYVYIIILELANGESAIHAGDITLLR